MSQQSQFPYSVENISAQAWSSNPGTPILTPTSSTFSTPYNSVRGGGPYAPLGSIPPSPLIGPSIGGSAAPSPYGSVRSAPGQFPMPPGTPMIPSVPPSPFMPATPVSSPMPTPIPSAMPSVNSTPSGSMRGMPGPSNAPASLSAIFGPVPDYATANTSHYNLPFLPPPYKNFVPSPMYMESASQDFAAQNEAYHRRRLGIREEVHNGPRPEYWRHGLSDTIRLQNREWERRVLGGGDEEDEEEWKRPGCRCVIS
ncbi:hypothetical protein TWF281_006891 [Arthrobotrys megalospora]